MNDSKLEQPKFRDDLTIFLVSATVMFYQITLTRVLSVVVWYHFAFLTISIVMLGLGAFTVVASVMPLALSMEFGFTMVGILATVVSE
jgi:hypothetical protein